MEVIRTEKSNKFCGPAALSLLTGRPVDEIVLAVKNLRISDEGIRGYRPLKGMYNSEMIAVLGQYGFELVRMARECQDVYRLYDARPTLARWLRAKRQYRQEHPDAKILLNVTGHYLVLHGRKLYDNHNPEGVWLRQYRHRRIRVKHAWVCRQKTELTQDSERAILES